MYQKSQIDIAVLLHKNANILQPLPPFFTIDWSFKMRYCMNFYLNWHRNYAWSKLGVCFLLSKYRSSSFDHAQFLCHLRQKCIQYLILKLQSIVKKGGKGQRMFAFLCSKIALCIWDFQYIKWGLSILICTPLYDQYYSETISVCLKFPLNFGCSYTVLGSGKVSAGSISGEKSKQMLLKAGLDLHYQAAPSKII